MIPRIQEPSSPPLVRFEEKSTFRSGQEESEQEVIAAAIVLCDAVDAVDVVARRGNTNGCWIL